MTCVDLSRDNRFACAWAMPDEGPPAHQPLPAIVEDAGAAVAAIRAAQGRTPAAADARDLLDLSLRHLEAGRVRMIVVGGLPGTGKSTLAAGLGDQLAATVLRSDEIRKELVGLAPTTSAGAAFGHGIYNADTTTKTYTTVLDRAEIALARGESVVLDASWTDARWRAEAAAVAERTHSELVELWCSAPAQVAAERMHQRAVSGTDPSDATPAVAQAMAASMAPWPAATVIETSGAPQSALSRALQVLETDPASHATPAGFARP